MQAAVASKPDALITSLVDNNAFVGVLKDAKEKGITVLSSNVDATAGPELGLREAFIGQNFIPAGTTLGKRLSALFPKDGPIHVLVGVSAPGQNWAEQRAQGVMNGLEAFKKANPDRQYFDVLGLTVLGCVDSGAYRKAPATPNEGRCTPDVISGSVHGDTRVQLLL